jgi:ATP synthase F1 complex assembly factor 1
MSKEQIDELQKNPFFDKYAEKIAKLQQTSPEEFLSRLAAQEEAKKPKPVKPRDFTLPSAPKAAQAMDSSGEKTLDKVMKVELLADKSAEEIGVIWTEHWMHKVGNGQIKPKPTYSFRMQFLPSYLTMSTRRWRKDSRSSRRSYSPCRGTW